MPKFERKDASIENVFTPLVHNPENMSKIVSSDCINYSFCSGLRAAFYKLLWL